MEYILHLSQLRTSTLVNNIAKVFGGDVVSKVLGVGTAIILIRGMSVSDFAAFTAFSAVLYLLPDLIGGGVNRALVRFSAEHISMTGEKPFELYFVNFIFQIVLYTMVSFSILMLANKVTRLLFGPQSFDTALIYGLIGGLGALLTEAGRRVYQAEEKYGKYIKTLWLRQILILLTLSVLFLLKQLDFQHSALAIIITELFIAAIITLNIFWHFKLAHLNRFLLKQSNLIRYFFATLGWLILYQFILACFSRLGIIMLSHFSVKEQIAYFGVAARFYALGILLLKSIHAVLLPRFSKIEMQDPSKQRQFMNKWIKNIGWIIIPILLFDFTFKPIFVWIAGPQYDQAYYILVVLTIGIWISLTFSPLMDILVSRKDFKFMVVLALGALIINFGGNYLLAPIWGAIGVAMVSVISHAFINVNSAIRIYVSES